MRAAAVSKYGARRVTLDGYTFDSRAEARRYGDLTLRARAGEVRNVEVHPRFPIGVNGLQVCVYVADFRYEERGKDDKWQKVVEDVKGVKTPAYRLKKKLMRAVHGVEIKEVEA